MENKLRLAGVIRESIVDGPGWRFVVFAQGCPHRCKGCHNPQTHDFDGGYDTTVENIINEVKKNPYLKGVTLSGGEPFCQAKPLAVLAKKAHELGLDVITYTGYTYEELIEGANEENGYIELLKETDILVDGRFILEEKTLELRFRGSRNQRVIDPKASLKEGRVVETDF
ncbi:MAG: anaerobic ribonucleoside-triphosphate reductase activating protein [Clostridiales bacterium]|jgi:anaerobic ribonucleoside-triphosphate reductase activating protein|nr:anaerobic ribonucleoside-triphosphate reductase activating protein [Clostridiales bacterium]HOA34122.1 anaerobic ribonucleoside-triphosphate reductase activating protein [Clostridiales bacterium]HOJ36479.1 anaerobic ribonucleoside-triphosphate reductase activating protein [Clostridiales bacterium]HPU66775.1 anaerobic ribonucleoside-triphosphate reductase activating protein [Clostridiales bacterium]HQA05872.1 anaerobic ribonucleoside-triphosphate reductase activating protein [Clostridiales ba